MERWLDNLLTSEINIIHKEASAWESLSYEAQKEYLKRHPKSKKKITAKPGQGGKNLNNLKSKLEKKKQNLESKDGSQDVTAFFPLSSDADEENEWGPYSEEDDLPEYTGDYEGETGEIPADELIKNGGNFTVTDDYHVDPLETPDILNYVYQINKIGGKVTANNVNDEGATDTHTIEFDPQHTDTINGLLKQYFYYDESENDSAVTVDKKAPGKITVTI